MRAKLLIKASCSLILCFFIAITSATSDPAAPLVQQAARLAQAIEALDTETMVLMTAPEIVLAFHDESNARAQIESINAALRVYGAKPKVTVGEISTIFGESPRLGALVTYTMAMEVPQGVKTRKSYWLAISNDNGKTWRFIEGKYLTQEAINSLGLGFDNAPVLPATVDSILPK